MSPRVLAALVLLLVAVHEHLLWAVLSQRRSDAWYLQTLVFAQCAFLATSAWLTAAVARRLAHLVAGLAFTLPLLIYVDALVFVHVGRHIPEVLALLWRGTLALDENRRLLAATGIALWTIPVLLAALLVVVAAGAWANRRLARQRPRAPARARAVVGWLASFAVLAALEMGAGRCVRADAWSRFGRGVPQVLGAFGPTFHAKASFRAALRPRASPAELDSAMDRLEFPKEPPAGDVVFFVVESLRADAVDPATAPALAALARESPGPHVAVSGGNVTQYGWYSLFCAEPALYWQTDPDPPERQCAPFRIARRRGWRIEVLASTVPDYLHLDEVVFGAAHVLVDEVLDLSHLPGNSATHDGRVIGELAARLARPHGPTVYVVLLDATHLPYFWGERFVPPFEPHADEGHYMRIASTSREREAIVNRYRDAVAFVDSQIARILDAERAAGKYDQATIVVVGDHGEEFWDHGLTGHGSEICSAQTHVPLILKPGRWLHAARDRSELRATASTMDVWPTILDAAGVRGISPALFQGASLLQAGTRAALACGQRYWYRPSQFVIEDGARKVEFELTDADHPYNMQEVNVVAVRDADDRPTYAGLSPSEYLSLARSWFGGDLERFFDVHW